MKLVFPDQMLETYSYLPDRVLFKIGSTGESDHSLKVPRKKPDGSFIIQGLRPGHYDISVGATVIRSNDTIILYKKVKDIAAGSEDVIMKFYDLASIHGKVIDENGLPVQDFSVQYVKSEPLGTNIYMDWQRLSSTREFHDSNGNFNLDFLSPGKYYFTYSTEGNRCFGETLFISSNQTISDHVIRLDQSRTLLDYDATIDVGNIEGKVTDSFGNPMPNEDIRVRGDNKNTFSDEDGYYIIENVREGERTIDCSGLQRRVTILDQQTINVNFVKPATIVCGEIRDNSVVVARVEVRLNGREYYRLSMTNSDGKFRFKGVPDGHYIIDVGRPDVGYWHHQPIEVKGEDTLLKINTENVLLLGKISGEIEVLSQYGHLLLLQSKSDGKRTSARYGYEEDGTFSFGKVTPGPYIIYISQSWDIKGALKLREITVNPGESIDNLELKIPEQSNEE